MNVKIIERDKGILAYVPESMRFFEINNKTKRIIEALNENRTDQEIIAAYDISQKGLISLKNQLTLMKQTKTSETYKNKRDYTPGLYKLVLNISNACNLRCKHCFMNS